MLQKNVFLFSIPVSTEFKIFRTRLAAMLACSVILAALEVRAVTFCFSCKISSTCVSMKVVRRGALIDWLSTPEKSVENDVSPITSCKNMFP